LIGRPACIAGGVTITGDAHDRTRLRLRLDSSHGQAHPLARDYCRMRELSSIPVRTNRRRFRPGDRAHWASLYGSPILARRTRSDGLEIRTARRTLCLSAPEVAAREIV